MKRTIAFIAATLLLLPAGSASAMGGAEWLPLVFAHNSGMLAEFCIETADTIPELLAAPPQGPKTELPNSAAKENVTRRKATSGLDHMTRNIYVRFVDESQMKQILQSTLEGMRYEEKEKTPITGRYVIGMATVADADRAIDLLNAREDVLLAEPEYRYRVIVHERSDPKVKKRIAEKIDRKGTNTMTDHFFVSFVDSAQADAILKDTLFAIDYEIDQQYSGTSIFVIKARSAGDVLRAVELLNARGGVLYAEPDYYGGGGAGGGG